MGPLDIDADELQAIRNRAESEFTKPDGIKQSVWNSMTEADRKDAVNEIQLNNFLEEQKLRSEAEKVIESVTVSAGPLDGKSPDSNTQRWPIDQIQNTTDYVFFQFGKYVPPFGQDAAKDLNFRGNDKLDPPIPPSTKRHGYDASIARMEVDEAFNSIMLPIPQDLSNTLAAGWQGKAFTGMGRAAIAAVAGGNNAFALQKLSLIHI